MTEDGIPKPGEMGLTWITGWTGFWVSVMQWLAGDGGLWPFRRYREKLRRGYPTHAFMVLPDGMIIEAQPGGARIGSIDRYKGRTVLYSKLPLTDVQRSQVLPVAGRYEGVPYSFLGYLYLGLWRLGIRPEWLRYRVQSTGHQICSQLCDQILSDVGFHLFDDGRLPQDVTPGDLFSLLARKGWW